MSDVMERPPVALGTGGRPSLSIIVAVPDPVKRAEVAQDLYDMAVEACREWKLVFGCDKILDDRCGGVVVRADTIVEDSDQAHELMLVIVRKINAQVRRRLSK